MTCNSNCVTLEKLGVAWCRNCDANDIMKYQKLTSRTDDPMNPELEERLLQRGKLLIHAVGLVGEAAEVLDLVKKIVEQAHPLDEGMVEKLEKELGDTFWYAARTAEDLGLTIPGIAATNIKKLEKRYPDKFSPERSINRTE